MKLYGVPGAMAWRQLAAHACGGAACFGLGHRAAGRLHHCMVLLGAAMLLGAALLLRDALPCTRAAASRGAGLGAGLRGSWFKGPGTLQVTRIRTHLRTHGSQRALHGPLHNSFCAGAWCLVLVLIEVRVSLTADQPRCSLLTMC